jgi:FkbM family methyltransferase
MEIATIVYKQYLAHSRGIRKRIWFYVREALIKLLNDPICSLPIHGRSLKLPLSHLLPDFLRLHPFYDQLPQRISTFIHQKQGHLSCIDVGANIGDTIAAFYTKDTDTFLAIEPNPKFNKLLAENWGWNKNIIVVSDICSSGSSESTYAIQEKEGTASVLQTENGLKMRRRSLDEIVNDHPSMANANVLKIDTDGHDFEVITGANRLLSRNLPVVLFECQPFENTNYEDANYVEDCLNALNSFKEMGYNYFLVYDNFGHLMGRYSLSDLSPFKNLLFFQLTRPFLYQFDILVMKDDDVFQFYKEEIVYFVDKIPYTSLRRTANVAAGL